MKSAKENYLSNIRHYFKSDGLLTGEAIGLAYYASKELELSPEWLKTHIEPFISQKIKFMTKENLTDTIEGLKVNSKESPLISELEAELKTRSTEKDVFVVMKPLQASEFEYEQPESNNFVIWAATENPSKFCYYWKYLTHQLQHGGRLVLDN